jgi:uncharacterized protein YcfL
MRAWLALAVVSLALVACRVDRDGEVASDAYFPDSDTAGVVCEAHQMMCYDWETGEQWCCVIRCSAGCTGGGCSDRAPYCQGCFCP